MYFYGFDPTYILVIIGFAFALFASMGVKSTYKKYSKIQSARGITGAMAARQILDANGLRHVEVVHIAGELTDNFNPKTNIVSLSDSTYNSTSVAAIGVAAHECGHAVQHQVGYAPIRVRNSIVPFVNVCNRLSMILFIVGLIFAARTSWGYPLAMTGAILFGAVLVFQLVTLPTEINASRRAMATLEGMAILEGDELKGAKKVLTAAAMTYVAALVSTALQFLRLLILASGRRRN